MITGFDCDFSSSDRDFGFNLPALIRELLDLQGGFLGWNLNKEEVLSLMAVNPGLTDHGGGSRVTHSHQTQFCVQGQEA